MISHSVPAYSLQWKGRLLDLSEPRVMGILNITPDSFYSGSRVTHEDEVLRRAEAMLEEGAMILDVGGVSTRPNAAVVSESEEMERVIPVIRALHRHFPEAALSVDTWRARVAEAALEEGAAIINDISGGAFDEALLSVPARYGAPYILMHIQGTPADMQQNPQYKDVVREVLDYFIQKVAALRALGIKDIVLDPGFGFGKSVAHNYTLLRHLHVFGNVLQLPVLAGLSRKSMIWRPLGIEPEAALNATSALHMVALQQGARILRVHDVKSAVEVVRLWQWVG